MEAGLVGKKKKGKTWNNIPELQHDELENTMKELDAIAENNKYLWQEDKNDMQQCIIIDYEALPFVSRLYIPEVAAAELEELYKDIKQDQDTEKGWKSSLNLEYKKYWQEHYIYDAASNIDFRLDGWGKLDFTYSKANELKQIGNRQYHYDNNGNLMHEELDKLEISYSYTAENRLQEVNTEWQWIKGKKENKNSGVSYEYDALGRKISSKNYNIIKKNKNWKQEENEYYLYDGLDMNVAVEYRNTNKGYKSWKELEAVKEYTYGDSELLFSKDLKKNYGYYIHENRWNKNIYYHQDQLGSTILTTGHMGKTEEKFEYDAYGLCYNGHLETANGYGFNGKKYDPTTKLYNYGYRHYSPNRKQWLTVDPIRNGGNWRLYCLSNPLYYIDYNGLDTLIVNIPGLTDNRLESFLIQAEIGIWPDEDLNDVVSPDDEEELNEELKDIDESVDTIIFTGGHSVDFYDTSKIDVELEKDTELYFATCEEGLDKEALSDSFGVLEENVSLNTGKSWADNSYNFVRDTIYLDNPIEEAWNDYIEANDLYEENPNLIPNYAIVEDDRKGF